MAIAINFNICNGEGSYITYIISQTTATFIYIYIIFFFLFVSCVVTFGGTGQIQLQLVGTSHQIFILIKTKTLKNTKITEKLFPRLNSPNFMHT